MSFDCLTSGEWLETGLELLGPSGKQRAHWRTNKEIAIFKSHFGPHPYIVAVLWLDLQNTEFPEEHRVVNPTRKDLAYFLTALRWVKMYEFWSVLSIQSHLPTRTLSQIVRVWVLRIAALKEFVIVWPTQFDTRFTISIDGTHCQVNEPRDPDCRRNKKNYSHKYHKAGVNYEVGVSVHESKILHVKEQARASVSDTRELREGGLRDKLFALKGHRSIADKAYDIKEFASIISTNNYYDEPDLKIFKSRVRSRHETVNTRLKVYKSLDHRFRHGCELHQSVFNAAAVLTQYTISKDLLYGEPLFDPL